MQQNFDWMLNISKESIVNKPHNMELYFKEDESDSFISKLEKCNYIQYLGDGVKEAGWGQRSMHFYDLDGQVIEVGENMKMFVKRFLSSGLSTGGNLKAHGCVSVFRKAFAALNDTTHILSRALIIPPNKI